MMSFSVDPTDTNAVCLGAFPDRRIPCFGRETRKRGEGAPFRVRGKKKGEAKGLSSIERRIENVASCTLFMCLLTVDVTSGARRRRQSMPLRQQRKRSPLHTSRMIALEGDADLEQKPWFVRNVSAIRVSLGRVQRMSISGTVLNNQTDFFEEH